MKFIIRTRAETYFNILKIYIFFNFGFTGFAFKDPRNFQTVKGKGKIENTRELEYSSHISHIDSSLWFSVLFFFFLHYSRIIFNNLIFLGIFYSFQFSQRLVTNILLNSQPLCDFSIFFLLVFFYLSDLRVSDLCERLKIFSGFDWKGSLESGVHTTSVLPMPDNRQVQKNAMPNQSANNIEGRTEFSCTLWGVRRSDYSFVLRNMFYGFWCLIMVVLF